MDFKQILENKTLLYGIIGAIVVIIALFVSIGIVTSTRGTNTTGTVKEKVIKEKLPLLTTDNMGKALEIQALLAREGIEIQRDDNGTKSELYLQDYTQSQRDRAILAIVKSGLMDQNVGLEIFDKGDFTSTREDKKIRLARAINGELARLIRKIPPIEDASVFISIPDQTMFQSMQKPVTASVQVTIPVTADPTKDDKLDNMKVKAITNLLLGSVSGLEPENISITDTNGNVYSGLDGTGDNWTERSEENDKYMQQKVNSQLDKLIGKGNYVTTVSTFLRQSPIETASIDYNPNRKTAVNEQTFDEGLGDRTQDLNKTPGGPVSVNVPGSIQQSYNGVGASSQNKSYERSARETQYGVSKTQTNEYTKAGVIEDVSVAVTIDKNAIPGDVTIEELKDLISSSAGPKVRKENITIAFADSIDPYLAGDKPENLPVPNQTGNPWWLAIAAIIIGLAGGLKYISKKVKSSQERQRQELEELQEKTYEQERQLRDVNLKAAELTEKQNKMAQGLIAQQQREVVAPQISNMGNELHDTLNDIKSDLDELDGEDAGEKIKNWIEKG